MGARGGVFSPSCDASHLHPAPLQQHQAAQGRPSHHSSSAASAVLLARADRLLLGSDLPRGSLGAAPALGCLGPRSAGGLRPSTHSLPLGDSRAAALTSGAPAGLDAGSSAAASCPSISTTGSVHCRSVVVLQPGIQQVAFGHPKPNWRAVCSSSWRLRQWLRVCWSSWLVSASATNRSRSDQLMRVRPV